jgi:hypothetical protein
MDMSRREAWLIELSLPKHSWGLVSSSRKDSSLSQLWASTDVPKLYRSQLE